MEENDADTVWEPVPATVAKTRRQAQMAAY